MAATPEKREGETEAQAISVQDGKSPERVEKTGGFA
jgi:hypothetical protein